MYASDLRIAGALIFAFVVNMGLNHASGFSEEHTLWSDIRDSIVALGASIIIAAVILILINAIHVGMSFASAAGMIAVSAVPVSIGFSVANKQFGGGSQADEEWDRMSSDQDKEKQKAKADVIDVGITIAGATVFVLAVAPTEEIEMIASRTTGFHWAGLVAFSIVLTYAMVFAAEFAGSKRRRESRGLLQQPIPETVIAYVFSVLTGLLLLFILGQVEAFTSVAQIVANGTVIGLPAAVGGAAGRLLV